MRVQVHYLEQPAADYVRAAVSAAADLHATGLPGDTLIFLTGASICVWTSSVHTRNVPSPIQSKCRWSFLT